jgi:nucleoside-diphosphate-sugar epimerase
MKIYGAGLIAKELKKRNDLDGCFFAAGVSDSLNASDNDYLREVKEISKFIKDNSKEKIYYYSSFVAVNGDSKYANHKREIEKIIINNSFDYNIIRLPQVVGLTNNKTLVNYFIDKILNKEKFNLQKNAKRRLIDIEDVARITSIIYRYSEQKMIINIGPRDAISVKGIAIKISEILKVEPNWTEIVSGEEQETSLAKCENLLRKNDVIFQKNYQYDVLEKYVSSIAAKQLKEKLSLKTY